MGELRLGLGCVVPVAVGAKELGKCCGNVDFAARVRPTRFKQQHARGRVFAQPRGHHTPRRPRPHNHIVKRFRHAAEFTRSRQLRKALRCEQPRRRRPQATNTTHPKLRKEWATRHTTEGMDL